MTQEEIAKRLKVSQQAVSKWLSGQSIPRQAKLFALAKLLGEDPQTVLKELLKRRAGKSRYPKW